MTCKVRTIRELVCDVCGRSSGEFESLVMFGHLRDEGWQLGVFIPEDGDFATCPKCTWEELLEKFPN